MSPDALCRLSAREIAAAVASRKISPREVVIASLDRAEAVEPALNAFVQIDRDGALAQAEALERALAQGASPGPLAGVPVSVKDLIDVAGLRASYGSLTLKDAVAEADAPSVERLRRAGAIIIGKTTTSELGYRGYTQSLVHGDTRNPWDTARTPGGSSGGAVASVAAGVTPVALGTDGGGSIRSPAAFTGLVGIKASFGRVPVWPASATPTLAHVGPIARSVDDAALLLSVIAGPDRRDAFSLYPPMAEEPDAAAVKRLRVAFSPTLGYGRVDANVAAVVAEAVRRLAAIWPGIDVVEAVCPDPAEILSAEFIGGCSARLGDAVDATPDLIDPPLLEAIRAFRRTSADRYATLLRQRLVHRETMRLFFERYDLLLTPTTPAVAWRLGPGVPPGHETAAVWSYFTYPFNLAGLPAATLPAGLADGLPVGLQLAAPLLEEARIIASMRLAEVVLGRLPTPIDPSGG